MADRGPLSTALRISRVSAPELANPATALTSLLAVPVLEVILLVAVSASLGSTALVSTAYAAIILAYGQTIISGTIGQVTRDRQIGVLQETLTNRFFSPPYWASKVAVPIVLGGAVAVASCVAVVVIDPERSVRLFAAALLVIPVVAVGASIASVGVATLSVGLRDPYLISNVVRGLLPLTAGVVVPLASYPAVLAGVARAFPLTGAVEAMRSMALAQPGAWVAGALAREVIICGAWFAVGALASSHVIRSLRNGRREEIW